MTLNRRELLQKGAQIALGIGMGSGLLAAGRTELIAAGTGSPADSKSFPARFLWGAATAAHQVEGNNINSDAWLLEHLPKSMYREPSGDACDHYHLYEQDINLLADLGLNAYRFSIEWARIEPEKGYFSRAELDHYRRMLDACHRRALTPLVTYSHFTLPRWFAFQGAWENPESSDLFARYCERSTKHLGDLIAYAATFNEPDLSSLFHWINLPDLPAGSDLASTMAAQKAGLRQALNAPEFSGFLIGDARKTPENIMAAHTKGKAAIKSVRSAIPVGLTLAIEDDQPAGPNSRFAEKQAEVYSPWFKLAKNDDFIGVQTYSRSRIADKTIPPPENAERTQMGYEFYPESLEHTIRLASKETGVPVIVTENGVATENDARRVEYIQRALAGVKRCLDQGIDVRGYIHWSLVDNFEWIFGFVPKFGLIAVDRETQKRTPKPSAAILGKIARNNSL
ncbi:MAG TPA: family 1 glycosylhydrolase [Candidatus Sulfotelmatobacter sp.]|nr:family 1 glycosylhydrolase [Candidatus Sulfotelmatobacter sp.]